MILIMLSLGLVQEHNFRLYTLNSKNNIQFYFVYSAKRNAFFFKFISTISKCVNKIKQIFHRSCTLHHALVLSKNDSIVVLQQDVVHIVCTFSMKNKIKKIHVVFMMVPTSKPLANKKYILILDET